MRSRVVLLLLLILIGSAQAADLYYSSSLRMRLTMDSDFALASTKANPSVDFVEARYLYYPKDDTGQHIKNIVTVPAADKSDDYYLYTWESPALASHTYSMQADVTRYNSFAPVKKKVSFPLQELPAEMRPYIEPTEYIDINEDIIRKASEIAEGEDDLYKVVFKLATWTKENIEYSLTTATSEANQKASWVLDNRYGVCDELTNLFIAMCRSLGIPARSVSGVSYTDSTLFEQPWGLHGWAEVYFPGTGWAAFDPTYGQYGQLDPTHIKLMDSPDSERSSTRFEWQGNGVDLEPGKLNIDVEVLEQGQKSPKPYSIELYPYSDVVGLSSYNLIEADVANAQDHYIAFEITLGAPKTVVVDHPTKYVVLAPKEQAKVMWLVSINGLDRGYTYRFPVIGLSSLNYNESAAFEARQHAVSFSANHLMAIMDQLTEDEKTYSRNIELSCSSPTSALINQTFDLACTVKNIGNVYLKNIQVCIDTCTSTELGISQSRELIFSQTFGSVGEKEILITAQGPQVSKAETVRLIIEDYPRLEISGVEHPEVIEFGPDFVVSFTLEKNSLSEPKDVALEFHFNNKKTDWFYETIDSTQVFHVTLDKTALDKKENDFRIIATYHDRQGGTYTEAYSEGVELSSVTWLQGIEIWLNQLGRSIEKLLGG